MPGLKSLHVPRVSQMVRPAGRHLQTHVVENAFVVFSRALAVDARSRLTRISEAFIERHQK